MFSPLLCISSRMCSRDLVHKSPFGFQSYFALFFFGQYPWRKGRRKGRTGLRAYLSVLCSPPQAVSLVCIYSCSVYLAVVSPKVPKINIRGWGEPTQSPPSTAEEGVWRLGDRKGREAEPTSSGGHGWILEGPSNPWDCPYMSQVHCLWEGKEFITLTGFAKHLWLLKA